jgi:HlyD family secretion protein
MRSRSRIIIYGIAAVIVLVIGYGFMPNPIVVETAVARRGNMRVTIEEEGMTRVIDRFIISAPVAGFALRIGLDIGDTVSKGDRITELEPLRSNVLDPRSRAEAQARVAAAEASLLAAKENSRAANASADFAKKEFERISQLFKDSLVTQEKLDMAEADLHRTDAALHSSEFAIDVARNEKEAALTALKYSAAQEPSSFTEKVLIKAPVSGRVLKIHHESEGIVRESEALIEIGDPRALEVQVDVLSADAVRLRPGIPVLLERWGGDKALQGRVRSIEPAGFTKISALGVEEQRVLVICDIISPPVEWTQLGDGYRVEASFIIWEDENVLQIPSSALFRTGSGWSVFVMDNKTAQLRAVQTGYRNGLNAQIVSGLSEGEIVIPHPDNSIKNGSRVRPLADIK